MFSQTWRSIEDCRRFAERLSACVFPGLLIQLDGTLGAGKTELVKSFMQAKYGNSDMVASPTFVIIHRYDTDPKVYHIDAYRVNDEDEWFELGVEEIFEEEAIVFLEWGSKVEGLLPSDRLMIQIEVTGESSRQVNCLGTGERAQTVVQQLEVVFR